MVSAMLDEAPGTGGRPPAVAMLDAAATLRLCATRFADVRWFGEVGSTNAQVMALAAAGAPEGLVVVADHQAAGRGRLDRSWVEPPGSSLLVSILFRPSLYAEHLHLITAIVGLATADACRSEAGLDPSLKWPNDLLLGGHKFAGVLAEASGGAVVVGTGINVNWPAGAALPPGATSLNRHSGTELDRARLLVALLESLEARLTDLETPAGRAFQAGEYRRRCSTLGQVVRVQVSDGTFTGTAADITPEGNLLVQVGTCLRRVSAGDVIHLRPG